MKKVFTEQTKKQLVKKLHVLLAKAGIDEIGKRDILNAYGVAHSNELGCDYLIEICDKLESLMSPASGDLDRARKRAMAAIGGWLELTGGGVRCGNRGEYIKGIACRVTGVERFNAIPIERLRNVYSLFCNKQNDYKRGAMVELLEGMSLN